MAANKTPGGRSGRENAGNKSPEEIAEERIEIARRTNATELDLSGLGLTELPSSIGKLTELERLYASNNKLHALPERLIDLSNLRCLDLSVNDFAKLPERIGNLTQLRAFSIAVNPLRVLPPFLRCLSKLQTLHAYEADLEELPEWLGELQALTDLSVSINRLKVLPDCIGSLKSLETLCAAGNALTSLPGSLGDLKNLRSLAVGCNPIMKLPESIGRLSQLQALDVSTKGVVCFWSTSHAITFPRRVTRRGELASLPDSMKSLGALKELYLHGQHALGLPPEVLGPTLDQVHHWRGKNAPADPARILDYYFSIRRSASGSRPLNEAKMIFVGRGGVGKTSLVNRLVHGRYQADERKTDGIAITPWTVQIDGAPVRLNIWDFGGQEIMHATHQFFLTKRSLYVLVLNAREGEQDANVEYWLRLVESFGSDSPVLVVINKVNAHHFDLNHRGLQAKFPAIRGFFQTDCESESGLDELSAAIVRETGRLEHLRDAFPASWFTIKDTLASLPESEGANFIPFSRYQALCAEKGVTGATSQETLVGFLHDLGIVVNFRDDPRLAETHVLNPEWVTNGIYKILNADWLAKRQGELRLEHLAGVLDRDLYPKAMHLYLLDLMRKFELCYEFYDSAGYYLVPELLGKEEPDLAEFQTADALRFEYQYNILPEGLLPRFIVRSRALNKNLPCWRTGVVLAWQGNRAVVKADIQDRRATIAITGPAAGRRRLLDVIRADLEHIHQSIAKLEAREYVPVPGHPGLVVSYKKLLLCEEKGIREFVEEHNAEVVSVSVPGLLNGIDERTVKSPDSMGPSGGERTIRLVYSYSHKDEELRDRLQLHLTLLQRQQLISPWHDRKIMPGERWAGVIDDRFKQADLILLLVSPDFIASDYCYEIEMKTALEREAKGEAKVVPVILRSCNWPAAPFSKLQALPKDGKPVVEWEFPDQAWTDVEKGIEKVVEELRARRR